MKTFSRGKHFEDRVYKTIKKELYSGKLGLEPNSCEIFCRKGYISRERNSEIVVDISIEMTLPGANNWSLLWVWECKDYSSSVPVNDIEEFWAKLQQIGGVNIKGGVATSGPLQKSALKFAIAKGMSVVRLPKECKIDFIEEKNNDQISWISYDLSFASEEPGNCSEAVTYSSLEMKKYKEVLTSKQLRGVTADFYGISGQSTFTNWRDLLLKTLQSDEKPEK